MSEQSTCRPEDLREAVSIHTRKVTDSCRDKDCIEDLRVYLTRESQALLDASAGAKARCAELVYAYIDVEPVAFNRNHYCIDITFYYRILADAIVGGTKPATLCGLAVFSKRAVLCGEDSCAKIFTSDTVLGDMDGPDPPLLQPSHRRGGGSGSHDSLCPHPGSMRLPLRRAVPQPASRRHPESL